MKTTAEQIPHLSGLDLFNRLHDGCDMRLHQAPIIRGKREDADKTASHRILIRDVLIRSDQQVVTAFFCQRQQLAIGYFLPADLRRMADLMVKHESRQLPRRALVQEYLQRSNCAGFWEAA